MACVEWIQYVVVIVVVDIVVDIPTIDMFSTTSTCQWKSDFDELPCGKVHTVKAAYQNSRAFSWHQTQLHLPFLFERGHVTRSSQRIMEATRVFSKMKHFIAFAGSLTLFSLLQ